MNNLPYNHLEKNSIISFAKECIGKSVQSEFGEEIDSLKLSNKDKGQLGKVIEELYFKYKPNSDSNADFKEAGLELKTSGLKRLKKSKEYRAKERLVLSIINYVELLDLTFEELFLDGKNSHLLLIFYLYEKGINQLASEIKLVGDWKYPIEDIPILKNDWEIIYNKVKNGLAHELSEGDTFYLGACTKGSKGENIRLQPKSNIKAKQRAFSLKPGYLNHIIANISNEETEVYGKIIQNPKIFNKQRTIEEIVEEKFKPFYNKTPNEIEKYFKLELNFKSKNYYASLTNKILGLELGQKIEEFEKADIQRKTIRLNENYLPNEHISFPIFKYHEIINSSWESSNFKNILEQKFFFVFYQFKNKKLFLKKVKFWNMSSSDIDEVKVVWERTVETIKKGAIVKEINDGRRFTYFPNSSEHRISHVRPHATNIYKNVNPLPIKDKLTNVEEYTNHSFWLNSKYVKDEIFLK